MLQLASFIPLPGLGYWPSEAQGLSYLVWFVVKHLSEQSVSTKFPEVGCASCEPIRGA